MLTAGFFSEVLESIHKFIIELHILQCLFFCAIEENVPLPTDQRPMENLESRTTLNHCINLLFLLKLTHMQKFSIIAQFCFHILQILGNTFGKPRFAWPHPWMEWIKYVLMSKMDLCMPNQMEKISYLPKFILVKFLPRLILTCCFESFWAAMTTLLRMIV